MGRQIPESGTKFGPFFFLSPSLSLFGGVDSVEDGKKRQLKTEFEASDLWIWIWIWDLNLDQGQIDKWEKGWLMRGNLHVRKWI